MQQQPDAWLRGPVEGIDPLLMPAAHALLQAGEELERAAGKLSPEELWAAPGGAASVGFHLRHIAGGIDRLLTYTRGAQLSHEQLAGIKREKEPGEPPAGADQLIAAAHDAIETALGVLRVTGREELLERREVGRAKLPTNVLGALFHLAEHAQRHAGQALTTAKIVRGLDLGREP